MTTYKEIEDNFIDIKGINELKKVYKKLCKILHPDIGGSNELFKMLNEIYNNILENKVYYSSDCKFDLELEKVISQILHFEDIVIEVVGTWIYIGGDTKPIKETLKSLNFKWGRKKKLWFYGEMKGRNPKQKSMEEIKNKYGCEVVKTKQRNKIEYS